MDDVMHSRFKDGFDTGTNGDNTDEPVMDSPVEASMDVADTGLGDSPRCDTGQSELRREEPRKDVPTTNILLPSRPQIQRNQSQPPPPQQPPPPPAPQQQHTVGEPTDSLSLMQLKRIVTDMPRPEPTAYAFIYTDAASLQEELEEWFSYATDERAGILRAKAIFEEKWEDFIRRNDREDTQWIKAGEDTRRKFVVRQTALLESSDLQTRESCIAALTYLALGTWGETAGLGVGNEQADDLSVDRSDELGQQSSGLQMVWMRRNAKLLYEGMAVPAVFDVLRTASWREWEIDATGLEPSQEQSEHAELEASELTNCLTLMYLMVEAGRRQVEVDQCASLRDEISALDPNYLLFLVKLIAKLRWDDSSDLPLTKVLLLFWKSLLLLFGGSKELDAAKTSTREDLDRTSEDEAHALITASPLDYHLFRQEITSKYPAYNPPPPLLPLELENNSVLPPLANHPSRHGGGGPVSGVGPANVNGNGGSILHQPVHIATPAPSPPPSPIGPGGKAGKKQNYQTNQNFPFLYPPLDPSYGPLGNKMAPEFASLDRKWERRDIPASILEAGELFAGRMRMTRAIKQLWDERERYMRFERGWSDSNNQGGKRSPTTESSTVLDKRQSGVVAPKGEVDVDAQSRLDTVEHFYRVALPHLQSLVIVLLKVVLANVTSIITQQNSAPAQNGLAPGFQSQESLNANAQSRARARDAGAVSADGDLHGTSDGSGDQAGSDTDDLDTVRSRETTAKAVSGLLLLLLKWFKISHVLKFEYLTQLLLDSNYLPLILKLFAHQDLDRAIDSKADKAELSFFTFCRMHSDQDGMEELQKDEEEDDACPPPVIKRHRNGERPALDAASNQAETSLMNDPPELDELGYPVRTEPITSFSWRNFFSSINYLRIMQKICKNKAHRNLLLVQYKSSTILKKCLKVPQPELRLYTLKLFKNQVPYCGRKWRQTNMRVITAIYLHCRPELRDDWLAGSDVDAEVEEALPLEQALRALTHWHNLKEYPDQMGAETGVLEEEQDFFVRELEKMDFGDEGSTGDEINAEGAWEGPVHLEGWPS
ncbi:MAG: Factor arrest protein 11 [Piccolia ochrophora]|nr:MAG: Factor arrest protein 11 [Piccolia ochrophora]